MQTDTKHKKQLDAFNFAKEELLQICQIISEKISYPIAALGEGKINADPVIGNSEELSEDSTPTGNIEVQSLDTLARLEPSTSTSTPYSNSPLPNHVYAQPTTQSHILSPVPFDQNSSMLSYALNRTPKNSPISD